MTLDSITNTHVSVSGTVIPYRPGVTEFLRMAHANQWPISVVIFAGSIKEAARVSPCSPSGQ